MTIRPIHSPKKEQVHSTKNKKLKNGKKEI